ncbi:ferritin [Candidatus Woesearchaeota archaeon]|nr:ferritin [Candidatus Woesearchaeota archaeon]
MQITQKINDAINRQINAELHSAYIYLSMAAYFGEQNLDGFESWMKLQSEEEIKHAMKLYAFLIDRQGSVVLADIKAPPATWKSAEQIFETAYKHEQHVTQLIHNLLAQARKDNDFATEQMLQWFVKEQVEEEQSAEHAFTRIKLVKGDGAGLLILDKELGKRKNE